MREASLQLGPLLHICSCLSSQSPRACLLEALGILLYIASVVYRTCYTSILQHCKSSQVDLVSPDSLVLTWHLGEWVLNLARNKGFAKVQEIKHKINPYLWKQRCLAPVPPSLFLQGPVEESIKTSGLDQLVLPVFVKISQCLSKSKLT